MNTWNAVIFAHRHGCATRTTLRDGGGGGGGGGDKAINTIQKRRFFPALLLEWRTRLLTKNSKTPSHTSARDMLGHPRKTSAGREGGRQRRVSTPSLARPCRHNEHIVLATTSYVSHRRGNIRGRRQRSQAPSPRSTGEGGRRIAAAMCGRRQTLWHGSPGRMAGSPHRQRTQRRVVVGRQHPGASRCRSGAKEEDRRGLCPPHVSW